MNIVDEVKNDFKMAIKKIDFENYIPHSSEFMDALIIGIMWRLLSKLDKCCLPDNEPESVVDDKVDEETNEISNKLSTSKQYLQKYIDGENAGYKSMALNELNQVEVMLKKEYAKLPNADEKAKLKNYEYEHSEILKQINSL